MDEPGADLAIALAVASAARGVALPASPAGSEKPAPLVAFGEIGLTGELRAVAHSERRIAEAGRFGLGDPIAPGEHGAATLVAALRSVFGAAANAPGQAPANAPTQAPARAAA